MQARPSPARLATCLLLLSTIAPPLRAAPPIDEHTLDRRTEDALRKGATFLLSEHVPESRSHDPAVIDDAQNTNARVLFTLLSIGRSIDDQRLRDDSPQLAPRIAALARFRPTSCPAACAQAIALSLVPLTPEIRAVLANDQAIIEDCLAPDGGATIHPPLITPGEPAKLIPDVPITAQALIALHLLDAIGIESPPDLWQKNDAWLRAHQRKDGGWSEKEDAFWKRSDRSATLLALSTLYITRQMTPAQSSPTDDNIPRALAAISAALDLDTSDYEYLHHLERLAKLAGLTTLGSSNLYSSLVPHLLEAQQPDGAWRPRVRDHLFDIDARLDTCAALLILADARIPVIFSKLAYGPPPDTLWNAHPDDAGILTRWISQQFDKPLDWQTLTFSDAPSVWDNAPLLLITGSTDPHFTATDIAKLKSFINAGGIIFSSADNGSEEFTAAIKKYAAEICDHRYEMRELPPTHELFGTRLFAKIPKTPTLLALSNGLRELWIHSPTDLAAVWQSRKFSAHADFIFPANLVRYATGMGTPRNRFQSPAIFLSSPPAAPARTIHLARLEYKGNFDPEPGAWPRLAALAATKFHTQLDITTIPITKLDAAQTPIAHMTGTDAFTLTPEEIASLKKFLMSGGTLLADSAGASPSFTASFKSLMTTLAPETPAAEIPINDPLYNGSLPDSLKITDVDYNKFVSHKSAENDSTPHLLAVTQDSRHLIIFSPEDLTTGLLGTEIWGTLGFSPDSAAHLAQNLILYPATK